MKQWENESEVMRLFLSFPRCLVLSEDSADGRVIWKVDFKGGFHGRHLIGVWDGENREGGKKGVATLTFQSE